MDKNNTKNTCRCPGSGPNLTILHIEGVGGQPQRGAAVLALEAGAVEELALCAQPLHHVHALTAEEAHVAAADVGGELLSQGALRGRGKHSLKIGKAETSVWRGGESARPTKDWRLTLLAQGHSNQRGKLTGRSHSKICQQSYL